MSKIRVKPMLSQHFLTSQELVARLVAQAKYEKTDTILEIGPGKGIITAELLKNVAIVIGVELDEGLCEYLRLKFGSEKRLQIVNCDFLQYKLPSGKYKVISNTPFAIESAVLRKLLDAQNPPEQINLILIEEFALRWLGLNYQSQFSIYYLPWWKLQITYKFKRTDFDPPPTIASVMVEFKKKDNPLLPISEKSSYQVFLQAGFGGGGRLSQNLAKIFSKNQMTRIAKQWKISFEWKPTDLSLEQWIQLYQVSKIYHR